ncbi:hypothetical protein T439DRAFT_358933 [Meredithblackwellia eburnea MCA 4105]
MPFSSKSNPIFHSNKPGGQTTPSSTSGGRPLSPPQSLSPRQAPYSRALPNYGNPNHFPNPPTHYFPSIPAAQRARMAQARQPSPPPPTTSIASESNTHSIASKLTSPTISQDRQLPGIPSFGPATDSKPLPSTLGAGGGGKLARIMDDNPPHHGPPIKEHPPLQGQDAISSGRTEQDEDDDERDELDSRSGAGDSPSPPADSEAAAAAALVGVGAAVSGAAGVRRQREPEWNAAAELVQIDSGTAGGGADSDAEMDVDDAQREDGPAKKRSRTLTTAHQTAVLNALLAKTRFPSTETREEVGQQIGMSARRVQIWFQNRRQSQKRARDRETAEANAAGVHGGMVSMTHPSAHHADYLSNDPYANVRYAGSRPGHLSRQASIDSIASAASFSSAQTSMSALSAHRQQQVVVVAERAAPRWPGPSVPYGHQSHPRHHQWSAGIVFPAPPPSSRVYQQMPRRAPPHPMTHDSEAMASEYQQQQQYQRRGEYPESTFNSPGGGGDGMKLAPIQGLDSGTRGGNATPQDPPSAPSSPQIFNYRPPPLSSARSFTSDRTAQPQSLSSMSSPSSSSTTLPRFDTAADFSRLRISNPPPPSSNSHTHSYHHYPDRNASSTPPDILDEAMEAMARPGRVNPPRSSLPPLRAPVFHTHLPSLPTIEDDLPHRPPPSEADALLQAPILKTNANSSTSISASSSSAVLGSKPTIRLPPISSLSLASSNSSHSSAGSTNTITAVPPPLPSSAASGPPPPSFVPGSNGSHSSRNSSVSSPTPGFAHRSSTFSHSSQSTSAGGTHRTTPARSSISSFDTLGSHWAPGGSMGSSRTSFSSEVQEEWERASAALGGSMRVVGASGRKVSSSAAAAGNSGQWEPDKSLVERSSDEMEGVTETS